MAILAECPVCHKKQKVTNKVCDCGTGFDKAKKSGKVRYWIQFRLPGGKQRKEYVGTSIEEARDADGKRRVQKRENRIFDILPEAKMTFEELTNWYTELAPVKKLASYKRVKQALSSFNKTFGDRIVGSIKPVELEEYQERRERDGKAAATIDMEISIAKTMIVKAFDNDMVDGRTVKAFRKIRRKLKKAANARRRTVTIEEYQRLCSVAPAHLKAFITIGFNTGMRAGEIRMMQWSYIDREKGFIRLPEDITKERKAKIIPINHHVQELLDSLPRAIHHGFVLTYRGEPIQDRGGFKRSFGTACKNAGIPCGRKAEDGMTFHDIRRTVKTNMLNAGVNKVHRDLILGHSLQGMDVHYIVPSEEDLRAAMERYTAWLDKESETASERATTG